MHKPPTILQTSNLHNMEKFMQGVRVAVDNKCDSKCWNHSKSQLAGLSLWVEELILTCAIFLEDYEIKRRKRLIRHWITPGFIKANVEHASDMSSVAPDGCTGHSNRGFSQHKFHWSIYESSVHCIYAHWRCSVLDQIGPVWPREKPRHSKFENIAR